MTLWPLCVALRGFKVLALALALSSFIHSGNGKTERGGAVSIPSQPWPSEGSREAWLGGRRKEVRVWAQWRWAGRCLSRSEEHIPIRKSMGIAEGTLSNVWFPSRGHFPAPRRNPWEPTFSDTIFSFRSFPSIWRASDTSLMDGQDRSTGSDRKWVRFILEVVQGVSVAC